MSAPISKVTIQVMDQFCRVTMYQQSEGVWIAVGLCMGEEVEVSGKTDAQALRLWRDAAKVQALLKSAESPPFNDPN